MTRTAHIPAEKRTCRILAVDDDPLTRETLDLAFSIGAPGAVIATAGSAVEAMEMLSESEFDVLMTDINMPGVSGIELISRVRKDLPDLPIVVYSGCSASDLSDLGPDIQVIEKGSVGLGPLISTVLGAA